jgi:light-independent protochlorophyllide reductase subunit B
MGFEGASVLFDTWVHPLMMGLEEHLIGMFRGDSEFHEDAAPSHLGGGVHAQSQQDTLKAMPLDQPQTTHASTASESITVAAWDAGAEKELKKIPFFVRGKARRNTERYATERGISVITTETLYESKAYYSQS